MISSNDFAKVSFRDLAGGIWNKGPHSWSLRGQMEVARDEAGIPK